MAAEKAVLVSVWLASVSEDDHLASLAEMGRLARTLGFEIVATLVQRRRLPGAAAVVGGGKLAELARLTGGSGEIPSGAVRKVTRAKRRVEAAAEAAAAATRAATGDMAAADPEAATARAGEDDDSDENGDDEATALAAAAATTATTARVNFGDDAGDDGDDGDGDGDGDSDSDGDGDGDAPVAVAVAEVIIVDNDISPAQVRNLERATDAEVFDRSAIIIEIFHRHARTREARLQVELARLAYEAPRLRDRPRRSNRQRAGSVGGAGESDLELDRRRIRDRMAAVRRELQAVAAEGDTRRAHRAVEHKVALVGYTNAGKSSLMRALTGSEVLVADQLFATLGTTVRVLAGPVPPKILVSDTVGFIRDLPHDLVASFRSTLDEARDAALLLFVVDAADPAFRDQLAVTRSVLGDIGASATPQRLVLNKADQLTAAQLAALAAEFPDAIAMSTHAEADVAALRATLRQAFEASWEGATFAVSYLQQALVREIHLTTRVLSETYDAHGATLTVRGEPRVLRQLAERLQPRPAAP